MSPGLVLESGELWLGSWDAETWGDYQNKEFHISNSAEALITFNKGHQCLLKLYVHLGWGFPVWWEKSMCYELHQGSSVQALAYEVCDRTCTPLHSLKTLEMANKSTPWLKKLKGVRQIARLKQQRFLSFTFFKTQIFGENHVYLLFHWLSGENCIMFIFSSHKEWWTSTD